MINVAKTYLPPFEEYTAILKMAWDKNWVTNNGSLLLELEQKLKEYLGVEYFLFCTNGTIVLQMALKAFNITGEVITTPFSYVATTNAILWEGCKPVFVDIRPDTYCIDETKIEAAITEHTQAILATHVYGFPCDVDAIQKIADKYNLKIIYDGAHAFGCTYKGKSLLDFGDISTCSFHATKIFHTVEGGALICNDEELYKRLYLYRQFGHIYDDYYSVGINAKNSEFHAAMGLCILPKVDEIIERRKLVFEWYDQGLKEFKSNIPSSDFVYNYGYYPILFENEELLIRVKKALEVDDIFPRRYFFPSLNRLPFREMYDLVISDSISSRVLILPVYHDISFENIERIAGIINSVI